MLRLAPLLIVALNVRLRFVRFIYVVHQIYLDRWASFLCSLHIPFLRQVLATNVVASDVQSDSSFISLCKRAVDWLITLGVHLKLEAHLLVLQLARACTKNAPFDLLKLLQDSSKSVFHLDMNGSPAKANPRTDVERDVL